MSREDGFLVRHSSWPAVGESNGERAVVNRLGSAVVTDFITQLILGGWAYHMQLGTEDAPINSTTAIDDELVWAVVDNNAGYATIPLAAQVVIANWTTATLVNAMLEIDKSKKRYSSGGTAYTPANLRGDSPRSFNGAAYVGTDITALAKSAVPASVELWRGLVVEDAQATPAAGDASIMFEFTARKHVTGVLVDASSLVLHFGATTADVAGYGLLQFAQVDKAMLV